MKETLKAAANILFSTPSAIPDAQRLAKPLSATCTHARQHNYNSALHSNPHPSAPTKPHIMRLKTVKKMQVPMDSITESSPQVYPTESRSWPNYGSTFLH